MGRASIGIDVKQPLAKLTHRFRQQQYFSEDYSPLYAALLGTIACWLTLTADIWHHDEHHHYQLGWVQLHGHQVQLLPGLEAWIAYW